MKQTVYVDVLVIINVYINYGLLLLSAFFRKLPPERLKILFASLFGGIYSLIILTHISELMISLSRIPALLIMAYIAFGFKSRENYIKAVLSFFGVNLIFAGTMFMLWFLLCPDNMYYNSGIVYFDIDAFTLVMLTVAAYFLIRLISALTKSKIPWCFSFAVKISAFDKEFRCRALYDSGNSLCDPFSGEGVTVVNIDVFGKAINTDIFEDCKNICGGVGMRLLPVKTLSGTKLLPSFRADCICVKSLEKNLVLERPIIAVTDDKIHAGEYGALLYSGIFDDTITGKGGMIKRKW